MFTNETGYYYFDTLMDLGLITVEQEGYDVVFTWEGRTFNSPQELDGYEATKEYEKWLSELEEVLPEEEGVK